MNKKVTIALLITLLILAIALVAFSNIKDVSKIESEEVVEKEDLQSNVEGEEAVGKVDSEEVSLEFDVNEQYTDPRFLITLKKYEIKDNVYKFKLEILNINDEDAVLDYSLFKCVINQQSVDINEIGSVTISGKKKKNLDLTCNGNGEEVYLTYLSTMYDGKEVVVSLGKK